MNEAANPDEKFAAERDLVRFACQETGLPIRLTSNSEFGKAYQRLSIRDNTRKRLEMLVERFVYDPSPANRRDLEINV